ncbi:MAG: LolA family protein [Solirubrobacteraceae bacterium]
MRRLRTASTRRLYAIVAAVAALAAGGGIAQAALSGSNDTPPPKPLDRAVHDALTAPDVQGVTARIEFTNDLLPAGSLPEGAVSPLAAGAEGRLWMSGERFRLELQSDAGDAQVTSDGERLSVYDSSSNVVYVLALPDEEPRADRPLSLEGVSGALDRLARFWTLSGAQPTNTADRPSYTLRIAPKDDGGLLGAAELAWDAANGVPLRAGVYAQGQAAPVLEIEVTEVDFGPVADADLAARPPAGANVVEVDPVVHADGEPTRVRGVEAVQERLDFPLAAPAELAGLPRQDVRLIEAGGRYGAVSVYGEGMGAIVVLQREASGEEPDVELPQVNIDGATGIELATALGTLVTFDRDGVSYTVAGSVPPIAAENAARELR